MGASRMLAFSRYRIRAFRRSGNAKQSARSQRHPLRRRGETPIMAVAPAIGNAIFNATKRPSSVVSSRSFLEVSKHKELRPFLT